MYFTDRKLISPNEERAERQSPKVKCNGSQALSKVPLEEDTRMENKCTAPSSLLSPHASISQKTLFYSNVDISSFFGSLTLDVAM